MDALIRKLSISIARMSTRRGFLSGLTRAVVGVGLGASWAFGAGRYAFADTNCKFESNDNCGGTSCSTSSSDANGCYGLKYCNSSNGGDCGSKGECPSGYEYKGGWTCCCNGKQSTCNDCGPSGGARKCICQHAGNTC